MIRTFIENLYTSPSNLCSIDEEQYKLIEEDISYFNNESQIYTKLLEKEKSEELPAFFTTHLKKSYQTQFIQNMLIKNQTHMILSALEDNKLSVIALKGPLFSEKYYGDFAARPSSDIDLLIKREDLNDVITCINKLGYINEEKNDEDHFHRTFSKPIPGSPVPLLVEIHWNLLRENTSELPINQVWDEAITVSGCEYVKELSSFYTFYFIILHAWRHNLDSMKHFLDIIQIIHRLGNKIDYELLFRIAQNHKTLKRVKRTLSIVYQQFPHLNDLLKLPFKKEYGSTWQYEVIRGVSVNKSISYLDFIDYQFNSFDTFYHRCIALFEWLFPSEFGLIVEVNNNKKITYTNLLRQRVFRLFHSAFTKNNITK
ncbi:nucleotidyltransferase family protein [Metabacillus litoralis]|uniref:nucleotidyltransferase family protein n=1 Tax=Metabacillus litoralis TaxID=152268 RepID=UPI001CFCD3A8|nr:nucleotidyltransferase family protein [Metabacillus litoralis]